MACLEDFIAQCLPVAKNADQAAQPDEPQTPPAPEPPIVLEPRCFLIFSEANNGSFWLRWCREPTVEGALALFEPGVAGAVPEFKLVVGGGISELCRGVGGPNAKLFYAGWCSFIRKAAAYGDGTTFWHLANVPNAARHVAVYTCDKQQNVHRLQLAAPLQLDALLAVAVVHEGSGAFEENGKTMRTLARQMVRRPRRVTPHRTTPPGACERAAACTARLVNGARNGAALTSDHAREWQFINVGRHAGAAVAFSEARGQGATVDETEIVRLTPRGMRQPAEREQVRVRTALSPARPPPLSPAPTALFPAPTVFSLNPQPCSAPPWRRSAPAYLAGFACMLTACWHLMHLAAAPSTPACNFSAERWCGVASQDAARARAVTGSPREAVRLRSLSDAAAEPPAIASPPPSPRDRVMLRSPRPSICSESPSKAPPSPRDSVTLRSPRRVSAAHDTAAPMTPPLPEEVVHARVLAPTPTHFRLVGSAAAAVAAPPGAPPELVAADSIGTDGDPSSPPPQASAAVQPIQSATPAVASVASRDDGAPTADLCTVLQAVWPCIRASPGEMSAPPPAVSPALQPPPPPPRRRQRVVRCYLVFSESNGGSFLKQWSDAPEGVPGALASFLPRSPPPAWQLSRNGGCSELCRGVPMLSVWQFAGWSSFVKLAWTEGATFTHLGNLPQVPVKIHLTDVANQVWAVTPPRPGGGSDGTCESVPNESSGDAPIGSSGTIESSQWAQIGAGPASTPTLQPCPRPQALSVSTVAPIARADCPACPGL